MASGKHAQKRVALMNARVRQISLAAQRWDLHRRFVSIRGITSFVMFVGNTGIRFVGARRSDPFDSLPISGRTGSQISPWTLSQNGSSRIALKILVLCRFLLRMPIHTYSLIP